MNTKDIPPVAGVYKIAHSPSGRVYIGSSNNMRQRSHAHKSDLTRGVHSNSYLQRAWNEYGAESFEIEVIHRIQDGEVLLEIEQRFMDLHGAVDRSKGFNLIPNAMAFEHTVETKRKIGESSRGRKHTPETLEKLRQCALNRSPEHVAKLREAASNRTPEHKAMLGKAHQGKTISEARRAAHSALMRGKPKSPDHRARISAAHKGKALESHIEAIRQGVARRDAARVAILGGF